MIYQTQTMVRTSNIREHDRAQEMTRLRDMIQCQHDTTIRTRDCVIAASHSHTTSVGRDVIEEIQTHLTPRLVEIKDDVEFTSNTLRNLESDTGSGFERVLAKSSLHSKVYD